MVWTGRVKGSTHLSEVGCGVDGQGKGFRQVLGQLLCRGPAVGTAEPELASEKRNKVDGIKITFIIN